MDDPLRSAKAEDPVEPPSLVADNNNATSHEDNGVNGRHATASSSASSSTEAGSSKKPAASKKQESSADGSVGGSASSSGNTNTTTNTNTNTNTRTLRESKRGGSSSGSVVAGSKRGTRFRSRRSVKADSVTTQTQDKWAKLQNLKNLLNAGFINKTEYKERKAQLIDEMTGTTMTTVSTRTFTGRGSVTTAELPVVVPRNPPDFKDIQKEKAVKYVYDLEKRHWESNTVWLKLDPVPFSRGGLRFVYHMQELAGSGKKARELSHLDENKQPITYVAKISIDPRDQKNREVYFRDVEMQALAGYYAKQFNEYNPPNKVDFVKAYIFELIDRQGRPICGVERFIHGPYRKHNNNFGYVSEEERNTPQAFSHFTYEASNHKVLVVDIQGVGDMYTDPQVHSVDGRGFGKGNMGQRGIDKFLKTHSCNAICRYLKLPGINANYAAIGTLPVTQFMSYKHIAVVNIANNNPTQSTPLLPPRAAASDEDTPLCRCTIL